MSDNYFIERAREKAQEKRAALLEDAAYYRALNIKYLDSELSGCDKPYLADLAIMLGLPHRYDNGTLKNKDVLVATLHEHFRTRTT